MNENFESPDHALWTGFFVGELMRHDVKVHPILDSDGNYTPRVAIYIPALHRDGSMLEIIVRVEGGTDTDN